MIPASVNVGTDVADPDGADASMELIRGYTPPSSSVRAKRILAAIAAGLAIAMKTAVVCASEYGIGTYRPGLVDLFAGYLGPPGTTLVKGYFLFQNANERAITENGRIEADSQTTTYTSAVFTAYITPLRVLGSYCGFWRDHAVQDRRAIAARRARQYVGRDQKLNGRRTRR